MPELPRLSGRKTISILTRMGFAEMRQRGSHVVLRRGETACVVPLHKELATGTLRSILRQAGVSPEEFVAAYESH